MSKVVNLPQPPPPFESEADKKVRWAREDTAARAGRDSGNPFATLCDNCMGRHWSPKDKECPYPKFVRK